MTDVLILSKTRMNNGYCCIGGIILSSGQPVRLLSANGHYYPDTISIQPKQIHSLDFVVPKGLVAPHVETVHVSKGNFTTTLPVNETMHQRIVSLGFPIWHGDPTTMFQGLLKWQQNGKGYISGSDIPSNSVGFWISDQNLIYYKDGFNKDHYSYGTGQNSKDIKYVGFDTPILIIPAGTLLRVSLAKWWKKDAVTEERCYLQLSCWYDYP